MAEELVMTIKSNIKGVTKDTEALNNTLSEQKQILLELQKEEIALQQKRANMTAYERSLSGIDKQLEHINLSIKDQKLAVKGLTEEQKGAVKEQKEYNKASKETIADFSVMGVSLNSVKKGFSQIIPTAKAMFGTIRAGIMSTGIGALVLAVVALTQSFKRSEAGQEKFQRIMAGIGAVTNQVLDLFSDLGEAIIDTVTSPMKALESFGNGIVKFVSDPMGATRDLFVEATVAVKNFVDETKEEIEAIDEVTKARQKAHHIDRQLKVERAKANREINDIRLQAEDREKFNATERIALLRKAQKIEEDITAKEIKSKQLLVDALKLEMEQNKNNIEIKDSLAQLEADLINLDTKKLRGQRLLQTQITTAINQEKAEKEQAAADAQKIIDDEFDAKIKANDEWNKEQQKSREDNIAADKKAADDKKKIEDAKMSMQVDMANQGLQIIGNAAGEGTALAKAAAIAQATISGVQGVQNAFTAANANIGATAGTFGAYPVTMAALAGTFAAMNIAKIASGGGGGVTPPSTGGRGVAAAQTPAPQMMSGAFELSGGVAPEAMRAYVVTDEMTNSQNQLANIRRRATI
jgi:hypothetical protein